MQIFVPTFSHLRWMELVGYTNDSTGHAFAGETQLSLWRSHAQKCTIAMSIKCIYEDPDTDSQTIIATANWIFHERERPEERVDEVRERGMVAGVALGDAGDLSE